MKKTHFLAFALALAAGCAFSQTVSFGLTFDHQTYVKGEPVVLTLKLVNQGVAPIIISDYEAYSANKLVFEIIPQDGRQLTQSREGAIVDDLSLERDEGQAIKINLSNWFVFDVARYRIRAQLFCNGLRYDSLPEVFDVVPGIELAKATHYVSLHPAVERTLTLVYWAREGREIAFLRGDDRQTGAFCQTLVLGDVMRVKTPSIERKADEDGVFYVYRQVNRDTLSRVEVASDAKGLHPRDVKRAVESASSPMIDSLREAVERKASRR